MGTLRSSQLEVLVDGCEWHRVHATLDETALTFTIDVRDASVAATDELAPGTFNAGATGATTSAKRVVRIVKPEGHGLGISIQGGADNATPVVVSKIFAGMAADQTGQLYVGDAILAVNGESLVNASHDEAVRALKRAGKIVNLEVQYKRGAVVRAGQRGGVGFLQQLVWEDVDDEMLQSHAVDSRDCERSFSLKLAYVTRTSLEREDIENKTIEMRSHNGHVLTLRCGYAAEADVWFESLHACAETLLIQALAQVNLILGQNPPVKRMGWLAEQSSENGVLVWRPVFAALTVNDLLFYDSVPAIKQEWASPRCTVPLIATRLVQTTSRTYPVIAGLSDVISFTTRTGTQEGIRTQLFRVETHRDLSAWVKSIVHYTYEACIETSQVSAPCVWQDQHCELLIQLDKGITLLGVGGNVLWQYPFQSIRATGDDGRQYLWFDFGAPDSEQEVNLLGSPKAVVFVLHSFLATKVHQLGLYA